MPTYMVEVEGHFYRQYLAYATSLEEAEERVLSRAQDDYDPGKFDISTVSYSRKATKEDLGRIEPLDDKDALEAGLLEAEDG